MNIQPNSPKEEIISNACELIDTQADVIKDLQEQQTILFIITGLLLIQLF